MYRPAALFNACLLTFALILTGCTDDLAGPSANEDGATVTAAPANTSSSGASAQSTRAAQPGPMIWANGELFRSIVTSATFSGDQGNFDALYVLSGSYTFKGAYTHLSDSAPGDQDYNGGRWEVFHLKSGVDGSKYDDVSSTSDAAFDHNDWVSIHVYFECPMLPNRGR